MWRKELVQFGQFLELSELSRVSPPALLQAAAVAPAARAALS